MTEGQKAIELELRLKELKSQRSWMEENLIDIKEEIYSLMDRIDLIKRK
jgi:chaperonin cofactor prefoldin